MINEKMQEEINKQIMYEFYSAYLYMAMAAYFSAKGLDGMSSWMRAQAQEELVHGMKFYDHLRDRDGKINLLAIEQPKATWKSPLDAWQEAYKHEQFVTSRINTLVTLSRETNDYASMPLLNWFVEEQIEEESSTSKVAQTLEQIGNSGSGLVMLDRELATRTFTYPTATQGGE
ncbi:MAG: ferritin [Pseudomonadota bacterium]